MAEVSCSLKKGELKMVGSNVGRVIRVLSLTLLVSIHCAPHLTAAEADPSFLNAVWESFGS